MCRIKGLRKYVRKHGRHFTEELAMNAVYCLFNPAQVVASAQKKVYYNVTSATVGDMVYLTNYCGSNGMSKGVCIDRMLSVIGNYRKGQNAAFDIFINNLKSERKKFDFNRYI